MTCAYCKRNIATGVDTKKMIIEYTQADGSTKVFGYMMTDGPITAATGRILHGWHNRCFYIIRKRELRGDAVTGRVLNGIPTGYQISSLVNNREEHEALSALADTEELGTRFLSERLDTLREIARAHGKAIGDPTVLEAVLAQEHGGPYPHTHHLRMDTYQLVAHLGFAHGFTVDVTAGPPRAARTTHDELHAVAALADTKAARAADPGYTEPPEHDWRTQSVVDL